MITFPLTSVGTGIGQGPIVLARNVGRDIAHLIAYRGTKSARLRECEFGPLTTGAVCDLLEFPGLPGLTARFGIKRNF